MYILLIQVQLLVSDADVESYKQIKSDLDVLRQSVEKSELWVYKSNKPATATITPGTQQQNVGGAEHQQQKTQTNEMSIKSTILSSSQQVTVTDTLSTEFTATYKETSDFSTTDSIHCSEEELEEDDEYKKIQKVMTYYYEHRFIFKL